MPVHVPPLLAAMLTKVEPTGIVSVNVTLLAVPVPLFCTVMVMVAIPPAGTGSGETTWLESTKSALCAQAPPAAAHSTAPMQALCHSLRHGLLAAVAPLETLNTCTMACPLLSV